MNGIARSETTAGAAVSIMKRGAWNVNSMTLTSELAAIRTPSTRPGPPPIDASTSGNVANTQILKMQPHANRAPAVRRPSSPRASRYDLPNIKSKLIASERTKNQLKPADVESSTLIAPTANRAPITKRQRSEVTRPRAADSIDGSENFSTLAPRVCVRN